MPKISADYIYDGAGAVWSDKVLVCDDAGKILQIDDRHQHDPTEVAHHAGVLVPGFVNTHCHLELSHMKGKVDTGTHLIPFITNVVRHRDVPQADILAAIAAADADMLAEGIVAVGDISNKLDTADCKRRSPLRYHTFVELFDFLQDAGAEACLAQGMPVYAGQPHDGKDRRTAVPHAPYTVSKSLFEGINALNAGHGTVSIHNQETPAEDELFVHKTGDFVRFYEGFGIPLDGFSATGQPSIRYALAHLDPRCRLLLVHNTLTTPDDIAAAHAWGQNGVYWATCANANLYIENRLPNYRYFLESGAKMTIGTDSLTSNWQLSVLEELKTISRYQSYVPFGTLVQWATLNGAEALQFDDELGSIAVGKTPGLNLLTGLAGTAPETFRVVGDTRVRRVL